MGILRFLLALSVVLAHSSPIFGVRLVGGQIAVQAFYIISGFYMTLILNEKYIGANDSYKLFISNRFLRLYPIYWAVLLMTIAASVFLYFYTNGANAGKFAAYAEHWDSMSFTTIFFLIFTNLFLFLQDTVMFLGLDTSTGNLFFTSNFHETSPHVQHFMLISQAWTIGVEITFYLIAPFLVRRKLNVIIPLILLSLLLRLTLTHFGLSHDPWSYRFFPTELVFFMLGMISYRIYEKIRDIEIKKSYLSAVLFGVLGFTFFFYFLPIPYKYPIYLFLFFICLPFIFILTKKWKYDIYIGELSYPIYISHILVIACTSILKIPEYFGIGLNVTILTIIVSIGLNELIAKKIEKIRQKRLKPNASLRNA